MDALQGVGFGPNPGAVCPLVVKDDQETIFQPLSGKVYPPGLAQDVASLPWQILLTIFVYLIKVPWRYSMYIGDLPKDKENWLLQVEKWGPVSLEKLVKIYLSKKDRFFKPLETLEKAVREYKVVRWGFFRQYEKQIMPRCIRIRRTFDATECEDLFLELAQYFEYMWTFFFDELDKEACWANEVTPQILDASLHW